MVMVQFWLAGRLGQVWLGLHKSLRPRLGQMPAECAAVAARHQMTASRLYAAQKFAAAVWWRASMVFVLALFPVIGIAAALHVGRVGTNAAAIVMSVGSCAAVVSAAQMGMLFFRSAQVRLYLLRASPQAGQEPLPSGSLGLPRRWDFWSMLVIAVITFGILLYAASRTPHGG